MYITDKILGKHLGVCYILNSALLLINSMPIKVSPTVRIYINDGKMYGIYHSLRRKIFKQIST